LRSQYDLLLNIPEKSTRLVNFAQLYNTKQRFFGVQLLQEEIATSLNTGKLLALESYLKFTLVHPHNKNADHSL
jgi:hypothetical protein